jgi:hypothetical protein
VHIPKRANRGKARQLWGSILPMPGGSIGILNTISAPTKTPTPRAGGWICTLPGGEKENFAQDTHSARFLKQLAGRLSSNDDPSGSAGLAENAG